MRFTRLRDYKCRAGPQASKHAPDFIQLLTQAEAMFRVPKQSPRQPSRDLLLRGVRIRGEFHLRIVNVNKSANSSVLGTQVSLCMRIDVHWEEEQSVRINGRYPRPRIIRR